jgi:threonine/homoserine/homoserine lactone efflux protein
MTVSTLLCFLGASAALTLAPGPDSIFIISQGIARGRRPAIVTALGMCSGISIHTTAAAFGISAIFATSALAFTLVKSAGALYLLYLAWQTLREHGGIRLATVAPLSDGQLFKRGFIMNVTNPKVAMFFLAFLPQFVSAAGNHLPLQMLLLGSLFMVQAIVIFTVIGYCSGSIGHFVLARPRVARAFDWLTAGLFTALGIRLALAQR